MTEVRNGDTVRVVLEGEVSNAFVNGFDLGGRGSWPNSIIHSAGHVASVEVVKRAKPRAGDTVEGVAAYNAMPVGTVLQRDSDEPVVRVPEGFYDIGSRKFFPLGRNPCAAARKILYIPED